MSPYKHSLQPFNYLKERAESNPDQLLFDGIDVSATNIFAFEFVKKLATFFREIGVRKGQTVALYLPEPLYIMFMIATWHEAAISMAFLPSIESKLTWTPDWLFATEDFPKDSAKKIIKVDDLFKVELEKKAMAGESFKFDSAEDTIKILFSSGTTGIPKAIPLTIAQLEARENTSKMYWPDSGAFLFTFRLTAITSFQAFFANLNMKTTYLLPREASHNLKLI
jgi:acyl-CoA synthetase (AMP-forming)/AMP-acid ligase II